MTTVQVLSHFQKAELALKRLQETESTNMQYTEGLLKRAKVEALISIAESLEKLAACASDGMFITGRP